MQPRSRHRSADECTVIVAEAEDEAAPCAWFPEPPSLQLDEGGITATVRLANCGEADLDLRLRFRHEDGWVFGTEGEARLGVDAGPVEVTVRLDLGDREVRAEDRIRVEAEWQGQVLTWSEAAVAATVPLRPRGLRRALAVGAVTGAVALFWMLGGGPDAPEAVDLGPASADEREPEGDPPPDEPGMEPDEAGVDPGELHVDPGDLDFGPSSQGRPRPRACWCSTPGATASSSPASSSTTVTPPSTSQGTSVRARPCDPGTAAMWR